MTTSSIACGSASPATDAVAKKALRARLLAARRALPAVEKAAADAIICARILDWWHAHPVTSIGVYYPIRNEPDLLQAYNALHAQGVHLSLPNILGPGQGLEFLDWKPGDALIKDALGTSIPAAGKRTTPQALLIPCVGFNTSRFRLGYGGGFYDRTLASAPRPLTAGIAYAAALAEFVEEAHDIALDDMITEA